MRKLACAAPLLLVLLAPFGCAPANSSAPPASPSGDPSRQGLLVWIANNNVVTAEVEGSEIVGSTVRLRLSRSPEAGASTQAQLQGTVYDRAVSVTFRGARASGILGEQPFNLSLDADAPQGVTRVRGLVAGELSDYEWDANKWTGHVGRCGYELTGDENRFEGYRSCGGTRENVRIEIGQAFSAWSPLEKATILAMFLRN